MNSRRDEDDGARQRGDQANNGGLQRAGRRGPDGPDAEITVFNR